jgi:hypothetical protein
MKLRHVLIEFFGIMLRPLRFAFPAVTSADLTTLGELMKEVYDPVIQEQQNMEPFTWNEFDEGDEELGGDGWFFETKMGGNQEGIGARAERGDLPVAGHQRWLKGKIYWKNLYGTFELTGQAIEAAKDNVKAFANAKTEEIEGLTRDIMKDMNRQVWGTGHGILAKVSEAGAAAQLIFYVQDGQYLRSNMMIDIFDAAVPATEIQTSLQIASLLADPTPTYPYRVKVTCTSNLLSDGDHADVALGDTVHRENSATAGNVGYELEGLGAIADDGTDVTTYQTISRTTYPLWKGHLLDNSGTGRNLTLDLLQQLEDQIYLASGKRPDWIRMNLGQRRKYFDLVGPDKRYMSGKIDGGYERLDYNGNQLTIDIDHPHGEITGLTKSTIKKYSLRKFGLLDFDGQVLRQVVNKDLWRGHVGTYGNLGCKQPNCNGRLIDLIEPTVDGAWVY